MDTFTISSTVAHYPVFTYELVKNAIVGRSYAVSLAFVGKKRAALYNQNYRHKHYTPNVLSFPLTTTAGEIIICPAVTLHQAAKYSLSQNGYIIYLFIHGLLHLKGFDHSEEMEKLEQRYLRKFKVS